MMKVSIISAWYNEEDFAPFFLKHYDYVDEFHILLDAATDDKTREILERDRRVKVLSITYPDDGLDWEKKQDAINALALHTDCDWMYVLDADEFIWPTYYRERPKDFLKEQYPANLMLACMWSVYRHKTDSDLDIDYPGFVVNQRRHGNPIQGMSYGQTLYNKPVIVKPEAQVQWDCGCHKLKSGKGVVVGQRHFVGAHWSMAEPAIALKRRLQQKARQGRNNLDKGLGVQNHYITGAEIARECKEHEFDPVVF